MHRNLKPANILLRLRPGEKYRGPESLANAQAVISGLEWLAREGEQPIGPLPRDDWKAPEALHNPTLPAGKAEDAYSLGLIVQAMLKLGKGEDSAEQVALEKLTRVAGRLTSSPPENRTGRIEDCAAGPVIVCARCLASAAWALFTRPSTFASNAPWH